MNEGVGRQYVNLRWVAKFGPEKVWMVNLGVLLGGIYANRLEVGLFDVHGGLAVE